MRRDPERCSHNGGTISIMECFLITNSIREDEQKNMAHQDDRQERMTGAVRVDVARNVRQRLGRPENVRTLQAMPQFSVEQDLPDEFSNLLGKLDKAERRAG
ncbi:hypothetical protein [Nitratireductor indicus]|uniref:hypothetical protein n=1 Tax=Nitratireductor indicus TaxID=721133 RepID=UPI000AFDA2FD|nr:hypothetical protein [Nitratireductor indicus]MDS1137254.1 hypothetical protein [Nitratireductor indicus]